MIHCFKCQNSFETLTLLLTHFKESHNMTSIDPVMCTYNHCPRSCTNQRYFKKHFLDVHQKDLIECNRVLVKDLREDNLVSISDPTTSLLTHAVTRAAECQDPHVKHLEPLTSQSPLTQVDDDIQHNNSIAMNSMSFCNDSEDEENSLFSDEQNKKDLAKKIFTFCSNMYSVPSIPISHSQMIIESVINLAEGCHSLYKQKIINLYDTFEAADFSNFTRDLDETFTFVEETLKSYNSSYRTKKMLKDNGFFIPPTVRHLGFVHKRRKLKKRFCVVGVKESSVHVPLPKVLQKLFEHKNLLVNILRYIDLLQSEDQTITNVMQGQCWQNNMCHTEGNRIILPLFLFNDDLEVGNSLQGHSGIQKVNATYCTIPCFQAEKRASLHNVFICQLTKSSNLKTFGHRTVFKPLIDDLNFLSSVGISVKLKDGRNAQLFFQLVALIGDNLGLNTLGGFAQNFSTSNYCCRFCLIHKDESKYLVKEKESILRTSENYQDHCNLNNVSKTGVKSRSVFNDVNNFSIIGNCSVDPAHDIFEGVAQYDLCFMLKHYIFTVKYFSLDTFNRRVNEFNFGSADISNKPPPLAMTFKKKRTLKMSASETSCLLKYFGLLIGDLIPENDEVWQLYIALRKVVEIAVSPSINKKVCSLLAIYISEHHLLYISLTRKPLTSKFHNLIHYPRLINHFGPLVHLSTLRFESKHRILKSVATSVACKKNICLTMSNRCQMQQGHGFFTKKLLNETVKIGKNEVNQDAWFLQQTSIPQIVKDKTTIRTSWLKVHGTRYCEGNTMYVNIDEATSLPIFGLIEKIFYTKFKKVYFLLRNFKTVSFNDHYYAFKVKITNSYSVLCHKDIHDFRPHSAISSVRDDCFYVSLLHD